MRRKAHNIFYLFQFSRSDDTYMYDDSITSNNYSNVSRHWYDEPPYESDPDDFLMSGRGAAATIQVGIKNKSEHYGRMSYVLH